MSESKGRNARAQKKLRSLQAWREMQRDAAHAAHTEARSREAQSELAVSTQRAKVDASHDALRAQVAGPALITVDMLNYVRRFAAVAAQELKEAEQTLAKASEDAATTRTVLAKRVSEVRAIELVQDKRRDEAARTERRREQLRLDEHAIERHVRREDEAETVNNPYEKV